MPLSSTPLAMALFLRRLCGHSVLDRTEREAILAVPAIAVEIRAHIDFVRLGDAVDHACLVSEGLVGRFGQTEDGKRQFVSIHVPGEMADLQSVMIPRSTTALTTMAATRLYQVAHEDLRDLGFRYPAIAAAFWRDCVLDTRIMAQWLVSVGRRDARSRIAHFLCELAFRYRMMDQSNGRSYRLPMSQEQMGDALGLTSVHINRMLMALRSEGLVTFDRNRVEILDEEGLMRTGEFDSAYLQSRLAKG